MAVSDVLREVHTQEGGTMKKKKPKEPVDDADDEAEDVAADARDELLWEQLKAELRRKHEKVRQ